MEKHQGQGPKGSGQGGGGAKGQKQACSLFILWDIVLNGKPLVPDGDSHPMPVLPVDRRWRGWGCFVLPILDICINLLGYPGGMKMLWLYPFP